MRSSALPGNPRQAPARVGLLSLIELQARRHVRRLVGFTRLPVATSQLVEDAHGFAVVAPARAVAGKQQARWSGHARRALMPGDEERGSRFGAPAVGRQRPGVSELRLRGLRAAQCFGGRFGLRHGGTRLAGSEEALRAAQQLASDRLGQ